MNVELEIRGGVFQEDRLRRIRVQVPREWSIRKLLEEVVWKAGIERASGAELVYQGTVLEEEDILDEKLPESADGSFHVMYLVPPSDETFNDKRLREVKGEGPSGSGKSAEGSGYHGVARRTRLRATLPIFLHPYLSNPSLSAAYDAALSAILKASSKNFVSETGINQTLELGRHDYGVSHPDYSLGLRTGSWSFRMMPTDAQEGESAQQAEDALDNHQYPQTNEIGAGAHQRERAMAGNEEEVPQPAPHQYRIRLQMRLDVWLLLKLASFVFVLNQGGSPERLFTLSLIAGLVYIAQMGGLERLRSSLVPIWESFSRSLRGGPGIVNGTEHSLVQRMLNELKILLLGFISSLLPGWNFEQEPVQAQPQQQDAAQERAHQD